MMELQKKSIHDLRVMAQAFGVPDIFEKDALHLIQEIELKQQKIFEPKQALPPKPEYDARLMTRTPTHKSSMLEITNMLKPHIAMGLRLKFDHEHWQMNFRVKEDSGSMRMPLRDVLLCAERIMQ